VDACRSGKRIEASDRQVSREVASKVEGSALRARGGNAVDNDDIATRPRVLRPTRRCR
ncbi:MAG: hypothetical protein QOJ24_998, partial [Mycobacterium sp.]|nr:hypothetical protein [Mycobacterium sp.]